MTERKVQHLTAFLTQILRASFLSSRFLLITYQLLPDVPPHYTIAGWHVQSDEVWKALKEMRHTHHVSHLEAYNMHGKLLWPCHYCKYLQGAIVQDHFTLKHWTFSGKKKTPCDTYATNIFSTHVLIPPPSFGTCDTEETQVFSN